MVDTTAPVFVEDEQQGGSTVEDIFDDALNIGQAPKQSEAQRELTARLAAVTQKDNDPSMTFNELVDQNREIINLGEEVLLRNEAKLRKQKQRAQVLDELAFDALSNGDRDTAALFVDLETQQRIQNLNNIDTANGYSSLEDLAVGALQNDEMVDDPDYGAARQGLFTEDTGETLDILKEGVVKSLIFQNKLDAYRESLEERGALGLKQQAGEFAGMFLLPFYDTQGRLNVRKDQEEGGKDIIRPGKAIRRQIESLFSLPLDQFEVEVNKVFDNAEKQSGVFGVNETIALQILEEYNRGTIGDVNVVFTDVVNALDGLVVAGAAARLAGKGIKSLSGVAKLAGARKTAATIDTESILKSLRKTDTIADDVSEEAIDAIDHVFPTGLKPQSLIEDSSIEISGTLSAKLDEIAKVGDELEDIVTQGRLSSNQLKELVDNKIAVIRERNPNLEIEDFKVVTDPITKITSVQTFVGKRGGGGYATEAAARAAAARRGFVSADVVEENGHFFIRQSDVVEELGSDGFPLVKRPDNSIEVIPESGPITAGIKATDLLLPEDLTIRLQEAQMANVKVRERIIKPLADEITKIGKKNLRSLKAVLTMSTQDRKWYGIDEFALKWKKVTGSDPTEQDFIAYAAAKQVNDVDFAIHNNHLYTNLARRGAKTLDISNKATGFEFNNLRAYPLNLSVETAQNTRMFDVEAGIVRSGKADTVTAELDDIRLKLDSGNYQIFRLQEELIFEGDPIHTILVPSSSVTVKPLARQVLNYNPGGHLLRRTKWFAKQPHVGTYKDGTEFVRGPRTLATYRTERVARDHVESINSALRAYRDFVSGQTAGPSIQNALAKVTAREQISKSPFESLENLERMVQSGKIDASRDFEAVFDRGLPSFYFEKTNVEGASKVNLFGQNVEDHLDGTLQWLQSTGRDYYGKRTSGLLSPHEDAEVVLDPLATLSRGIEHAARTHAYDNFLNRAVEEWVRAASPFIRFDELGGISDARHIFFNGRLNDQLRISNPNVFDKLSENRTIIQRQMGVRTPSQERFEVAKRNLARFVEARGGELGTKLVNKIDDLQSNNPITAINSAVFDAWLGLFDLSQMFVQTQTIFTAVAASPKYGAQALGLFPAMRWMTINKSDNLLDYVAKTTKAIHGQEVDDFKDMIREFRKSGWNSPGGEISYLDNHANSIASSGVTHRIRQGRRAGRVFFNEAERWNRMVAWQIAWKETVEQLPDLVRGSEEFIARVNKRTNDFSISMTSASNSKIQQGIFSPVTRFMGYQMRLLEALLPKQFGGNPAFSGGAKARILASQVLLYGGKGLPFGQRISDVTQDMIIAATGEEPDFQTVKFIESGAIDSVLYAISGGDLNTDFAERAGFGRGLDFTFDRLADGSMASMVEFMGGPALSFTSRYAESVNKVFLYFRGSRGPLDLDAQDAKFVLNELLVKHINSLKRAQKGLTIWRLGQVIDPRTGRSIYDATDLEGMAAFVGIPLFEDTERRVLQDKLVDNQEEVREVGRLIAGLDREAFRLMGEGDFKQADIMMRQTALILASYENDPRLKTQIAQFARNDLGYTKNDWNALIERVQSRLGPQEVPNVPVRFEEE